MLHSSFRALRTAFPRLTIETLICTVQRAVSPRGSLIIPAFSYCFKKSRGEYARFDRNETPSKVGAVSELFRKFSGVMRTSSPTHSFSLWGEVAQHMGAENAPESPLGAGSVLDWLAGEPQAHALLLGVDFSSLSFCHYIEIQATVRWFDLSPWGYLCVENIGVSVDGEQPLKEVPGCSRAFVAFEQYLVAHRIVQPVVVKRLKSYYIPLALLLESGIAYFKNNTSQLLCPAGSCRACDARRAVLSWRER